MKDLKKITRLGFILTILLFGCNKNPSNQQLQEWRAEVLQTEKEFAEMVKEKGLHDAFVYYADEEAVLMRNNALILGKKEIDQFYKDQNMTSLSWMPDTIHVAKSGDLAYTYGQYVFGYIDSTGQQLESTGAFHSIWKKQEDGSWKFVWD